MPQRGQEAMNMDFPGWLNWLGHSISLTAIVGTFAGLFPPIAALAAFTYYCLQIWRDPTVQHWLAERRERRIRKYEEEIKILRGKITRVKRTDE